MTDNSKHIIINISQSQSQAQSQSQGGYRCSRSTGCGSLLGIVFTVVAILVVLGLVVQAAQYIERTVSLIPGGYLVLTLVVLWIFMVVAVLAVLVWFFGPTALCDGLRERAWRRRAWYKD